MNLFIKTSGLDTNRPIVKPELTPVDWIIEFLSIAAILSFIGYIISQFPRLPDTIPSHFNGAGAPDGYDSKNTVWALPVIAMFLYLMMTLINLIPHKFNYVVSITAQNAFRQYTMATRIIRILKLVIILMFFYISFGTVSVATGLSSGLGLWFLPIFLGLVFIPLIIYFIMASRKS